MVRKTALESSPLSIKIRFILVNLRTTNSMEKAHYRKKMIGDGQVLLSKAIALVMKTELSV